MLKKVAGVVVFAVAVTSLSAMAEVPASVTSTITTAVADVATIGAAILGVVVGIAAFAWMRRPIK